MISLGQFVPVGADSESGFLDLPKTLGDDAIELIFYEAEVRAEIKRLTPKSIALIVPELVYMRFGSTGIEQHSCNAIRRSDVRSVIEYLPNMVGRHDLLVEVHREDCPVALCIYDKDIRAIR